MTSVFSMRLTTASTMRSILSLATEKSSSVSEEEPIFTTIRFAELICARKVASGNRSDRDSEVVEELMQVILTLPAVLIRRFSGNFVILTEIVLINKATTCLGGALSLCSRRTRCAQQSRILTTTGQCLVASGHWFPLQNDKSNGVAIALNGEL